MMRHRHHTLPLSMLLLAMSAMLVSSCDTETSNPRNIRRMKFRSTLSATRADTQETDPALKAIAEKGLGVLGTKVSGEDKDIQLFPNQKVTSADNGTTWTYEPVKYWDTDAQVKYYFSAYGPWLNRTSENAGTSTEPYLEFNGNSFTIHNLPQWQVMDATHTPYDLVVADNQEGSYSKFPKGVVDFTLTHKLAKFIVYVRTDADTGYTLQKISFGNTSNKVPAAGVQRTYTRDFRPTADQAATFTQTDAFNTDWKKSNELILLQNEDIALNKKSQLIIQGLAVPFNLNEGQTLPLQVAYTTNSGAVTAKATTKFTAVSPGYVYTLNLFITGTDVQVSTVEIQEWKEADPTDDPVYNW